MDVLPTTPSLLRPTQPRGTSFPHLTKAFTDVAQTVRQSGLLDRAYAFYAGLGAALALALAGCVAGFVLLGESWFQLLIAAALGIVLTQVAFLTHEAAHKQVLASGPASERLARALACGRRRLAEERPVQPGNAAVEIFAAQQEIAKLRRQDADVVGTDPQTDFPGAQPIAFVTGDIGFHVAVAYRALHQKPARRLHQAGGDAHAFDRIQHRGLARQEAGFLAPHAIQIARRLLNQRHAFIEGALEHRRVGESLIVHIVFPHPASPGGGDATKTDGAGPSTIRG